VSASAHPMASGSTGYAETRHEAKAGPGNEWLGMILFLVSEAVMFGSLFGQYFYNRLQATQWPPTEGLPTHLQHGVPAFPLALGLTIILALSGITAHNADTAIRRGNQEGLLGWLALTILLGIVFLGGQAYEYTEFILVEGFTPRSGIYGTVFYSLTGLHGLHVTGGVIVLITVFIRALMGHFSATQHFAVEGTVLYWHFVDIVWFALYVALYEPQRALLGMP
jgi:cytochrome c oxidase subunit 3